MFTLSVRERRILLYLGLANEPLRIRDLIERDLNNYGAMLLPKRKPIKTIKDIDRHYKFIHHVYWRSIRYLIRKGLVEQTFHWNYMLTDNGLKVFHKFKTHPKYLLEEVIQIE